MQGETLGILPNKPVYSISIHSPYAGGDAVRFRWFYGRCYFNPLPLCRGRHHGIYISKLTRIISIHSTYAGGDNAHKRLKMANEISIHSPYAGGDDFTLYLPVCLIAFQSTPPIQRRPATSTSSIT